LGRRGWRHHWVAGEHVLPEKPGDNWPEFTADEVATCYRRIGNMALLDPEQNSDLKSLGFADKKAVYANASAPLTSQSAASENWAKKEISDRQKALADLAVKPWSLSAFAQSRTRRRGRCFPFIISLAVDGLARLLATPLMKTLLKVMIALVAVGVLAVLFVRSAQHSRAEPFTIARQDLTGWTLTLAPDVDQPDSLLSITPKATLMPPLARELFARLGESLHYPTAAMPVVLRSEFQRAMAGALMPEALLNAARDAGLESAMFQPRCMARRRVSAPGLLRGVYFLLFDLSLFTKFREQVAQRLRAAGRDPSLFDPTALSPVLIAADLDGSFSRWLPLRADPEVDCFAPVVVE
jgi:hypothetical protein